MSCLLGDGEVAPILLLPSGRFLALGSSEAAELICVSGWHPPEASGARAAQSETMVRFRADAAVGTKISLVMRLAAYGRDFCIRICSGSGAETEISLAGGSERAAVLSCAVEPGALVTVKLSGDEPSEASYWMLKGILYFDPHQVGRGRILLHGVSMGEDRRAGSFEEFENSTDCYWVSCSTADRAAPLCADQADLLAFYSGCGNSAYAPRLGRIEDCVKLIRRSDPFVSTSRSSQGSIFDRSGVWRSMGYLQGSPPGAAPWISKETDGIGMDERALDSAPYFDGSYLIFYNGNLANYYHWVAEALVCLDVLSGALEHGSNLKLLLPASIDFDARFDHRDWLRAVGLAGREIVEAAACDFIRVREAVWLDNEQMQGMPAHLVKNFQRRVAALYAGSRGARNQRLLVVRKGLTRRFRNLVQVEAALSSYGFRTVYLEGMSSVDQILLFQSAEFIIGAHGAGLANLLFCEPGTKVIELMPSVEFRSFFWFISQKLELVYGLQFCDANRYEDDLSVDIDKLQTLIQMVDGRAGISIIEGLQGPAS